MPVYPKPGPIGGRLIRNVIAFLREQQISLPLGSHILIGVSGGADSVALAHLLIRYGRRVVDPRKVTLLHINHGWRGEASDQDARFVRRMARQWGVPVRVIRAKSPQGLKGVSWEAHAREVRQRIFRREQRKGSIVLTAHQADDLAETLLWRILTGSSMTHGGGILAVQAGEVRPLLRIRKSLLQDFLKEEGLSWTEDSTNHEGRFLRSRMRQELMPSLERLFPHAVDHLVTMGLKAQAKRPDSSSGESVGPELLLAMTGQRLKRAHLNWIEKISAKLGVEGELHLPGGWSLRREKKLEVPHLERWVLEKR